MFLTVTGVEMRLSMLARVLTLNSRTNWESSTMTDSLRKNNNPILSSPFSSRNVSEFHLVSYGKTINSPDEMPLLF